MVKYTTKDFDQEFPNDDACLEWIMKYRYPNGVHCPKCNKVTKYYRVAKRTCFECDICGNQIYPLVGTIFEKSTTPLHTWFHAMWLLANTRCGISAKQLQRETGVTYKTAWRMFKQIRTLMSEDITGLDGVVEVDETYIGGRKSGKRGRGASGKTIVMGMVDRDGSAIAKIVPDVKASTLLPMIENYVAKDGKTVVYTDELQSYNNIEKLGYGHEVVQHAAKQYVNGVVHVNTAEALWSTIKRGIDGVNHHVSPVYLQGYLDSYLFRYNHRKDETPMFETLMNRIEPHD